MLANELEAMTRATLSHFYFSTASLARHSLHMHMCHVVKHNRGHNRRVLPAMLAKHNRMMRIIEHNLPLPN